MIKDVVIKKIKKIEDERGWLAEVFRNDEKNYQPIMSYVSFTKAGVIRGPHEHQHQSDYFIFIGPGNFELHLWDSRPGSETEGEYVKMVVGEEEPVAVIVPPGVVHGYKCFSENGAYTFNLPDKLYQGKNKAEEADEIRWEQDKDSPYKIN
ncbi:MAG: dTDP-4-dehydrorhamnose 3,5-epimerase family protein [Candidatus Falkowbacteria bacterium]|nr:dTDP-4-dehydrorhamnose 3,5-epimerase family protein [Candidatus Falkowbacteria bacterium]